MKNEGKPTLALLKATYDIVERDLGLGFITPQDMRFTIEARKKSVKELASSGMSVRDIAKATGVSKSQIDRDLSRRGTKSVPKRDKNTHPNMGNHGQTGLLKRKFAVGHKARTYRTKAGGLLETT